MLLAENFEPRMALPPEVAPVTLPSGPVVTAVLSKMPLVLAALLYSPMPPVLMPVM